MPTDIISCLMLIFYVFAFLYYRLTFLCYVYLPPISVAVRVNAACFSLSLYLYVFYGFWHGIDLSGW